MLSIFKKKDTDTDIIEQIREGGRSRENALRKLYQDKTLKSMVVSYVLANGGETYEGEEIFQDTMLIFDEKVAEPTFILSSSLSTYYVAIAKWQWLNMHRKKGRNSTAEFDPRQHDGNDEAENPFHSFLRDDRRNLLESTLAQTGERCKKILLLWAEGFSMKEIAENVGLSSDTMAKKEKYRCWERFEQYIKGQSDVMDALKEVL
jgi:RNA polymerase sigma factor (sigma-70 family)